MKGMRSFLFQRFGAGKPEVLEKRVKHYLDGMPCPKTGLAFPPRCNMEDKLNALEKEREYLLDMCPKEKRDDYDDDNSRRNYETEWLPVYAELRYELIAECNQTTKRR
jgi:hypothetical protein